MKEEKRKEVIQEGNKGKKKEMVDVDEGREEERTNKGGNKE